MTLPALPGGRRVWLVLGALLAFAAIWASGLTQYLSVDALRAHRGELTAWVAQHKAIAALGYVAAYVAAVAFSLPGAAILTLYGGFLFGAGLGTLLAVIGATMGAVCVFLFARVIFGDAALERFGASAVRLAEAIRANAGSYLLVLRLVPLFPFFLVNLVPAFAGVPLLTFVVTTFLGIIPGTAVFALAGSGLGEILDRGEAITPGSILTPQIIAGLCGLAALSLLSIPIRKRLDAKG